MHRRPLPTLALASAACCLLLCGLWAVSWWRSPSVFCIGPAGRWTANIDCEEGVASVVWWDSSLFTWGGVHVRVTRPMGKGGPGTRMWASVAGFDARYGSVGRGRAVVVTVPLWPAILLTAVLPAWWIRRKRMVGARGFEVHTANAGTPRKTSNSLSGQG